MVCYYDYISYMYKNNARLLYEGERMLREYSKCNLTLLGKVTEINCAFRALSKLVHKKIGIILPRKNNIIV